jgi:hypothetical protein
MTNFVQPLNPAYPAGVAGIYDYASLKQAVQDWNARSDIANYIDYFIQRAEQTIYNDIFTRNKGVGVKPMETTINTTINSSGVVPLPTGYRGLKYMLVSLDGSTFELERRNAEFIYTQFSYRGAGGSPQYVARDGQNFVFGPAPDGNYAITGIYWQQFPQLTVTNTVTWMTSYIPLILLAACNLGIALFNKDQQAMQWWQADYDTQLAAFLMADRAEEQSGSAFAMVAA